MSSKNQIATDMIGARFEQLNAGSTSAQLHSETSMAIEMAHALGAIDIGEHHHYIARLDRIIDSQHQALMQRMESYQ